MGPVILWKRICSRTFSKNVDTIASAAKVYSVASCELLREGIMTTLLLCTRPDGKFVYVNMALVVSVEQTGPNTTITTAGAHDRNVVVVTESPDEIARLARSSGELP